jgi:excisionase family DNA binding protein
MRDDLTIPPAPERLWTQDQVAERLNVHWSTVHRWIKSGELPAVRLAKKAVRIRESDLYAFLEKRPSANQTA